MIISLDNKKLCYSGRIDKKNPKRPEFIFPASSLSFRFYGKRAALIVENRNACWENYVGAIVDGIQKCWHLSAESMEWTSENERPGTVSTCVQNGGQMELLLVEEEEEREHEILFFKRQDSCHELVLVSLILSEGSLLLEAPERPKRRIEVYGDSVSAGEVSEAVEYTGKPDPVHHGEYSNSWYSYAWMTARKLHAELHDIAQGGIPLLNGTGWVEPPVYPGMEFMWDKLHYHPRFGKAEQWDFSQYTPHLVILAIGQNDSNPDDYMEDKPDGLRAIYWKYKYRQLVLNIREKYPKAVILLTTTILEHNKAWDNAIEDVCREIGDSRILHFLYSRNGAGTPGHIRISEAEEMSQELADYINHLTIPVWDD